MSMSVLVQQWQNCKEKVHPDLPVPGPAHPPPPGCSLPKADSGPSTSQKCLLQLRATARSIPKSHWTQQNKHIIFPPSPPLTLLLVSWCWKLCSLLTSHLLEVLPLLFFLALLPHLLSITLLRSLWFLTWASWLASMSLYLWKPNLHIFCMFKTLYGPLIPSRWSPDPYSGP